MLKTMFEIFEFLPVVIPAAKTTEFCVPVTTLKSNKGYANGIELNGVGIKGS